MEQPSSKPEPQGCPYTLGEARLTLLPLPLDIYHHELIRWLIERVEELEAKHGRPE